MTAPTDEQVAAGLSEAQKRAVLRAAPDSTCHRPLNYLYCVGKASTQRVLFRRRIAHIGGELTPLGLRVRAILERQNP